VGPAKLGRNVHGRSGVIAVGWVGTCDESRDDTTSNLHDELRERLSSLCRKAERKGRKKSEADAVICWLTGYSQRDLEAQLKKQTDFETFFKLPG
jgi:hypothetical protein